MTSSSSSTSSSGALGGSSLGTQGASVVTQGASVGTHGGSSTVERDLAISMGVVGTLLVGLFIFLLWRLCIRRRARNDGNMNQIRPQYDPVSTIPGHDTHVPLNDNSIVPVMAGDYYGHGVQKYGSSIIIIIILPLNPLLKFLSLIVRIFMELPSPSLMIRVADRRRIVVNPPHSTRINQGHHHLMTLKDVFLLFRR